MRKIGKTFHRIESDIAPKKLHCSFCPNQIMPGTPYIYFNLKDGKQFLLCTTCCNSINSTLSELYQAQLEPQKAATP